MEGPPQKKRRVQHETTPQHVDTSRHQRLQLRFDAQHHQAGHFTLPYRNATPKSTATHKPFPWTRLPAELKNVIYDHFLKVPYAEPIIITALNDVHGNVRLRGSKRRPAQRVRVLRYISTTQNIPVNLATQLLLVDRQTHAEAGSTLYRNRFTFARIEDLYFFLSSLRPQTRAWLRALAVDFCTGPALYPAFYQLAPAVNVENFAIKWLPHMWSPELYAQLFHGVAGTWLAGLVRDKSEKKRDVLGGIIHLSDDLVQFMDTTLLSVTNREFHRRKGAVVDRFFDALAACL